MHASVTKEIISGFEAFTLENAHIRVSVIPTLGARVWELTDLDRGRQWIWHREGTPLRESPRGSAYDDVWAGGWEELFPNDAPGVFEGRELPDHGEWWTTRWQVADCSSGAEAVLRLVAETSSIRARCVKEFRLPAASDTLHISYLIESREAEPFHFLFKQHLPVSLSSDCRLALPGGRVTPVEPGFGTVVSGAESFEWPTQSLPGRDRVDLRRVPARGAEREFVYVTDVAAGWCGIDDLERGASLRLSFDKARLPHVWLFLSYGGWRDCYTAVLEPCTNVPKDLAQAVQGSRAARLGPGEIFATEASVTLRRYE